MTDQARVRSVSHRDLTQGSLPQHLWQLSWPITISQVSLDATPRPPPDSLSRCALR